MRNGKLRRAGAGVPVAAFLALVLVSAPAQAADVEYSTSLPAALQGKAAGPMARMDSALRRAFAEHQAHRDSGATAAFAPGNTRLQFSRGLIRVDVVAAGDAGALLDGLRGLGMRDIATHGAIISGAFPLAAMERLVGLSGLRSVSASWRPITHNFVMSGGVAAMGADLVVGADGSGTIVGVLSDSYDHRKEASGDQSADELPANVNVLDDGAKCSFRPRTCSDEGRAMMQHIYDVAPGADQAFHTAFKSMADFANGILQLDSIAGANVITDDVFYFAEPMFQDGILAQAVDTVVANGVAYFSSAGNQARQSYESAFAPSGVTLLINGADMGELHDFGGGDFAQRITVPAGFAPIIVLQWSEPFASVSGAPGSLSDVDIYLTSGTTIVAQATADNILSGEPVEILSVPSSGATQTYDILIVHFAGPHAALVKYVMLGSIGLSGAKVTIDDFPTHSPTLYGHANAAGAVAVGASPYTTPMTLEAFSSAGGTAILFDTSGNAVNDMRAKPEVVGPDGGNTTFFGTLNATYDLESDGIPNFYGTSAAAPHVAAVAALLIDKDPTLTPLGTGGTYDILEQTAVDMGPAGFDSDSGYGFVDAQAAVASVNAVNTAPVANNDLYAMDQDTTFSVSAANGVLENDSDADGNPMTATLVSGSLSGGGLNLGTNGSFDYTPAAGFVGTATFRYTASDGFDSSNEATVSITVNSTAVGGGNTAPVAAADSYSVGKGLILVVDAATGVLANDVDADSDPLTAVLVSGPATGTLSPFNADGSFTYTTPDANFTGDVTFVYQASDGTDLSAQTTVNIKVNKGKGGGGSGGSGGDFCDTHPTNKKCQ